MGEDHDPSEDGESEPMSPTDGGSDDSATSPESSSSETSEETAAESESREQEPADETPDHSTPPDTSDDPTTSEASSEDPDGKPSESSHEFENPEEAAKDLGGGFDSPDASESELQGPIEYTPGEGDTQSTFEDSTTSGASTDLGWEGPDQDEEMPLAAHIEEMLKRLAAVIAIAGIVSLLTFPLAENFINFLWNSLLPQGELTRPRLYGILELKLTELKVASLAGLVVALPVFVYETYQFMRPGLYPHERRYYLAAIPTSLVLAFIGISFAYFIILPAIFTYFLYYSQDVATIGFALGKTFDLILLLMGYMAIVFQIPLFIMLAMMMNLVTREWLAARRLLFWGAFLGISFIFSPDPTGMAPIVVALTMVALFEGTLFLTKWTRTAREQAAG